MALRPPLAQPCLTKLTSRQPSTPPPTRPQSSEHRSAVNLKLIQNKHLLQLLDRALCGKLERTDQDYDPDYSPSLFYNLIKNEFSEPDTDSDRFAEQVR